MQVRYLPYFAGGIWSYLSASEETDTTAIDQEKDGGFVPRKMTCRNSGYIGDMKKSSNEPILLDELIQPRTLHVDEWYWRKGYNPYNLVFRYISQTYLLISSQLPSPSSWDSSWGSHSVTYSRKHRTSWSKAQGIIFENVSPYNLCGWITRYSFSHKETKTLTNHEYSRARCTIYSSTLLSFVCVTYPTNSVRIDTAMGVQKVQGAHSHRSWSEMRTIQWKHRS